MPDRSCPLLRTTPLAGHRGRSGEARARVPSLRPESDSEEMRPTRVLGRQGYDPAVSLSRLDGVPFGKVGGTQLHIRPDFVRLLREELLQGLDRRLVGPGLNVQL